MLKNIILIIILICSIIYTYQFQFETLDIDTQLKQKATPNYLNKKIEEALNKDDIQTANIYKNLADFLGVTIKSSLIQQLQKKDTSYDNIKRKSKSVLNGFIKGDCTDSFSLGGKIVSDFLVVGDLRDIYSEGNNLYHNKEYDKFTLGLSAIGIGLTATSIFSFGATAPAKVGVSLLKVAKTSGKISKTFFKTISKKISKSVDFTKLKNIDFSSLKSIGNSKNIIKNSIDLKPIKSLLTNISTISKNSSKSDTIKLLKYIDSEKDLAKLTILSKKYKQNTLGVFKILGKGALKGAKIITKYSMYFIAQIISLIVAVLWFCVLLFVSIRKMK